MPEKVKYDIFYAGVRIGYIKCDIKSGNCWANYRIDGKKKTYNFQCLWYDIPDAVLFAFYQYNTDFNNDEVRKLSIAESKIPSVEENEDEC